MGRACRLRRRPRRGHHRQDAQAVGTPAGRARAGVGVRCRRRRDRGGQAGRPGRRGGAVRRRRGDDHGRRGARRRARARQRAELAAGPGRHCPARPGLRRRGVPRRPDVRARPGPRGPRDPARPAARRPPRAGGVGPAGTQPWLGIVFDAVSAQLGAPVPPPGVPGPFSLDDPDRLARLLADAELADVVVTAVATPLRAASFDAWWTRTWALAGPLATRLAALPEHARRQLRARLTETVRPYQTPAGLDFPGVSLLATGRRAQYG